MGGGARLWWPPTPPWGSRRGWACERGPGPGLRSIRAMTLDATTALPGTLAAALSVLLASGRTPIGKARHARVSSVHHPRSVTLQPPG